MKVQPAPERAVRDPVTLELLPAEGANVPDDDPFWTRRVLDADVIVMPDDPPDGGETLAGAAQGATRGPERANPAAEPHQPSAPAQGAGNKGD